MPYEKRDIKTITMAFESIKFQTRTMFLDSDNFESTLRDFLDEGLDQPKLIYVNSHGDNSDGGNLMLSR